MTLATSAQPWELPQPPLLLITDRVLAAPRAVEDVVAEALAGGCRWVMVRDKDAEPEDRRSLLEACLKLAEPFEATVTVNGDMTLARACGATSVHLQRDAVEENSWKAADWRGNVGISCHDLTEALEAELAGVDYVTLSPIFISQSKPEYGPALGHETLRSARARLKVPVIALGGIEDAARVRVCRDAGASGVAVMGAVMRAPDPARAVESLLAGFI